MLRQSLTPQVLGIRKRRTIGRVFYATAKSPTRRAVPRSEKLLLPSVTAHATEGIPKMRRAENVVVIRKAPVDSTIGRLDARIAKLENPAADTPDSAPAPWENQSVSGTEENES